MQLLPIPYPVALTTFSPSCCAAERDPTTRLPSAADLYPRALSLGGCSKGLSLPGLRIGWIASKDKELREAMLQLKDFTTICCPAPSEVRWDRDGVTKQGDHWSELW
jgi:hypothetical protein